MYSKPSSNFSLTIVVFSIFINNFFINKKLIITLTPSDAGDNNESSGIKVILAKNWSYHSCILWQQSGDPNSQTWNYCGITLLNNFTTALLYMVSSINQSIKTHFYSAICRNSHNGQNCGNAVECSFTEQ